jgi:UDP-N-acetylmuramate dehydrogenase
MNAGAFGSEIKDVVENITVLDNGKIITLNNDEIGFGYRKTENLLNKVVLSAKIKLTICKFRNCFQKRKEILQKRKEKQPLDFPSCGSVFKRPENNFAGALIESCGLKGFSLGGAKISEKHANFILNYNNANSSDIYTLINHVKETVFIQTGILLEEEVRLINFD